MTSKKSIKAFVAGMAFPAIFLPLLYTFLFFTNQRVAHIEIQFMPMYIPLVFGLANVLYVHMTEGSQKNANVSLWFTGGCLGFIVAVIGVFVMHFPTMIFGVTHELQYLPLVVVPVVYGLIFRYIVKYFNKTLSV